VASWVGVIIVIGEFGEFVFVGACFDGFELDGCCTESSIELLPPRVLLVLVRLSMFFVANIEWCIA